MMPSTDKAADPIEQIVDALLAGKLGRDDLTARGLAAFLGKTTGHLYHQWGSLGELLFRISQRGFLRLGNRLIEVYQRTNDLGEVAASFVDFGLAHPALYQLMFEHRFDWAELRARGVLEGDSPGLELWRAFAAQAGAEPARLLYAGLHGLVSLAASGRANVGQLEHTDREVAQESARALVRHLFRPTHEKPQ